MTTEYTTKDSGQRVEWETGSRRDLEDGKLDYSLLPYKSLRRLIGLYMRGAEKYGRYNWQKGQDMGRVDRSLGRHFAQYMIGERDEDHLAAIAWNAICLMDHEDRIESGDLPSSIDTRDEWRRITPPPATYMGLSYEEASKRVMDQLQPPQIHAPQLSRED